MPVEVEPRPAYSIPAAIFVTLVLRFLEDQIPTKIFDESRRTMTQNHVGKINQRELLDFFAEYTRSLNPGESSFTSYPFTHEELRAELILRLRLLRPGLTNLPSLGRFVAETQFSEKTVLLHQRLKLLLELVNKMSSDEFE